MRSVDAPALLRKHGLRVFTTGDYATIGGMDPAVASQVLRRLAVSGIVGRVKRALWVNKLAEGFHPYEVATRLSAPWPAYVSLQSVLSDAGVIAEVPGVVYGVSAARPRRYVTEFGSFHLHHLPDRLVWGYTIRHSGPASYAVADTEKAFCDLAYLGLTIRSPLGMPRRRGRAWSLGRSAVMAYAARFRFPPLLSWIRKEPFSR